MLRPSKTDRRWRIVRVTPEVLEEWLGRGTAECRADEQVPDLRILAVKEGDWGDWLDMLVESETFEALPANAEIPTWCPSYTRPWAVPA